HSAAGSAALEIGQARSGRRERWQSRNDAGIARRAAAFRSRTAAHRADYQTDHQPAAAAHAGNPAWRSLAERQAQRGDADRSARWRSRATIRWAGDEWYWQR